MSKRKKSSIRTRKKASKRNKKPDEYYRFGPMEMARFDKFIVTRNNMTDEQLEEVVDKLVTRYPIVCSEIDQCISDIVEIIKEYKPDELLKRAYWEMAAKHINVESEVDIGHEEAHSMRMVDYIQSIIVSVQPNKKQKDNVPEDIWSKLSLSVERLFTLVNQEYQLCRTAINKRNNENYNVAYEEYFAKAQIYWCNIRGNRYIVHEVPFYRDVLSPHDAVLRELYGVSVDQLLNALKSIQTSLTQGVGVVVEDMKSFQKITMDKLAIKMQTLEGVTEEDLPSLMDEIIVENNLESKRDDIFGRFSGLDLFDLAKVTGLPSAFLDRLSWQPGEDVDFFSDGEFKGWPLRIWPVFKKPFIKIDKKYYCFEIYSLHDKLYRIVQRIIKEDKPSYSTEWNNKQKQVSEDVPLELFGQLLPGSIKYKSVYYKDKNNNWCETDGLIIYDGHLFVIEVKAGAFTYTSPATDFPAYIESLKNLVLKPSEQGVRFLEYLKSKSVVDICDDSHNVITRIKASDYEDITLCAVTLDAFTELASQVDSLKEIGVDVGENPVWSISIDDLRVYTDIFNNPLVFIHYVLNRMRAFRSKAIKTEDELDHLGLYVNHNAYAVFAEEFGLDRSVNWYGYRSDIDKYFHQKYLESGSQSIIEQKMTSRLKELLEILNLQGRNNRIKVSNYILDCGGESRDNIADGIDDILAMQIKTNKEKPLSIIGDTKITLFCWQDGVLPRNSDLALDHARAVMVGAGEDEDKRLLLELSYDSDLKLYDVNFQFVSLVGLSSNKYEELLMRSKILNQRRIDNQIQKFGKIGKNDQCPCGSGKKFKRCCGLSKI